MTDHDEQRIRDRAHQMWVADGHPENRALHYWLVAEKELKGEASPEVENQGEGNRTAARVHDEPTRRFAKSGQIEVKAREIKRALDWPDGEKPKQPEAVGKKRRQRIATPHGTEV